MSTEVPQNPQLVPEGNLTVNPVSQKRSNLPLVLLSSLVLVLVGSGGFILAKYFYTSKPEVSTFGQPSATTPPPTQSPFSVPSSSPAAAPTDQPAPDPAANWKSYVNEKYNFQLKFPSELTLKERNILYPGQGVAVDIMIGPNIELIVRDPKLSEGQLSRDAGTGAKTVMFGNVQLVRGLTKTASIGGNPPYLTIVRNFIDLPDANLIVIYAESAEGEYVSFSSTFDQILSTFKFL